ncbi:molybdate ABC transporter substrate-binding protein [Croceicoccus sp. YJ47]|uniref:molybdate ABC transporter substrate-binding protein n=1 Tax=Croceicoccus sp. YJ47 TaxID=2798724 RepID=UPI001923BEDF|nr:molybdate ABC transporter substrate-binding protein [Croceicoccus sp. YJ47]QQN73791.1 molybdate ABC transporter substrate-binding protein [Croceicoccus sp. YJ47]
MLRALFALFACAILMACSPSPATGPVVLAASSMTEALTAAADEWAARGHARPVLSFAASSALARQLQEGAPADLFVSADEEWMDVLQQGGHIREESRRVIAGNALVLIAAADTADAADTGAVDLRDPVALSNALGGAGRLAMADPLAVPAGRYGRAALMAMNLWDGVAKRIAPAQNVRAALALVERGAAPLGITYATDAAASDRVRIVARFPESSHPPIRYPVAIPTLSRDGDAAAFLDFLTRAEGQAILRAHGFTAPR